MTRVIIVRHAETEWNAQLRHIGLTNMGLTKRGKEQAQALAKVLKEVPLTVIYSSVLKRSLQTAETIAKYHKLEVKAVLELNEIDFGEWEGCTWKEIERDYPDLFERWRRGDENFEMPGGESWISFKNRVLEAFQMILRENSGGEIALVAHGGSLKAIICETLNLGPSCFFKTQQNLASISILEFNENKATLTLLNDTCHLEH